MAYTKLFNSIITSTIWSEDDKTRIVWITMLAIADKNGEVQGSIPGLARIAGVGVEDCRLAIGKFMSPDLDSRTKDDEGRRIEEIDGGWSLLNHAKYRRMASDAERAEKATIRQQRKRARDNPPSRSCHAPVTPESRQNSQAEAEAYTKAEANPSTNTKEHEESANADEVVKKPRAKRAASETPMPEHPFPSESFAEAWAMWTQHRKEMRKPLTSLATKIAFEGFAEMGESRTIAAIRHSIGRGWLSINEDSQKPHSQPSRPLEVDTGNRKRPVYE